MGITELEFLPVFPPVPRLGEKEISLEAPGQERAGFHSGASTNRADCGIPGWHPGPAPRPPRSPGLFFLSKK